MKINPIQNANLLQSYRAGKSSGLEKGRSAGRMDEVSFSDNAVSFSKAMAGVREQMDVYSPAEQSRIDDIASRIRNGQYHVDSGMVAEKIIQDLF